MLLVTLAVLASTDAESLVVGHRKWGDHLIQFGTERKGSKMFMVVKDQKTFTGDHRSNITQIRLIDKNDHNKGATPSIINGGPGFSYVTVKFVSQRGHSIYFNYEIYGK